MKLPLNETLHATTNYISFFTGISTDFFSP
jgi:hypothetical protein